MSEDFTPDFDPGELRHLSEQAQLRVTAAARDAVAVVTALVHKAPKDATDILRDWIGPETVPGSQPHTIANSLLDLGCTHLRAACVAVGNDLSRVVVSDDATHTPLQSVAARAVAARLVGNDGPVALAFGHYLSPQRAADDVVRFLLALAAVTAASLIASARTLGSSTAQLLAAAGAAAS